MNALAGLYSYESVLMLLGIALFLALLVSLLRNVFKDKPFAKLLPAFLISVVMIGYPSVKSFQYGQAIIQLQSATAQLQSDPTNPDAQAAVRNLTTQIAPRAANDPVGKEVLQGAQRILEGRVDFHSTSANHSTSTSTSQAAGHGHTQAAHTSGSHH